MIFLTKNHIHSIMYPKVECFYLHYIYSHVSQNVYETVNIALLRFLHNNGNIATEERRSRGCALLKSSLYNSQWDEPKKYSSSPAVAAY